MRIERKIANRYEAAEWCLWNLDYARLLRQNALSTSNPIQKRVADHITYSYLELLRELGFRQLSTTLARICL